MVNLPASSFKETHDYKLYKGFDDETNCAVIYKLPNDISKTSGPISRLKNEYEISREIYSSHVVKSLRLETFNGQPLLVREYVNGLALNEFLKNNSPTVEEAVHIAISIAEALLSLHESGVYHKDINPSNIIINQNTDHVTLIDLGISAPISNTSDPDPDFIGTLEYVSPEQTGRINKQIDFRTDFYSLGIVFYKLVSGELPYQGQEILDVVHKHIAAEAPFVHDANNDIPLLFSRIIHKLMAKNPNDRYQSSASLLFDLEKVNELLKGQTNIDQQNYPLGQYDIRSELSIPDKLYGREKELSLLESLFDKNNPCLLISGSSGSGKTALALKLKEISSTKGSYFLEGKFDHLQKSIPYSALIQGLTAHLDVLSLKDEAEMAFWSDRMKEALGRNGSLIADIIPNLENFIGKQDRLPELAGKDGQNRFNNAFVKFIRALGTPEKPTVLFIDDLQWADLGSISIIQQLVTESDKKQVIVVGTYRSNEVHEAHPLSVMIRAVRDTGQEPEQIVLSDLSEENVHELCTDCFVDSERALELAKVIYSKTNGNAFYTRQLIKSLYEDDIIKFDPVHARWLWDLDVILKSQTSENVVEFMTAKLAKLSPAASLVLSYASCIGNFFDRNLLEKVVPISYEEFDRGLDEAIINGLLTREGRKKDRQNFQFVHDRIQQAGYNNLDEEKRNIVHLDIGRSLLEVLTAEQLQERRFDIVDQMNNGLQLIRDPAERNTLLELNIQAAESARQSAAYDIGLKYAKVAYSLLPENHWQQEYDKSLAIYNEISENAFLQTNFDEAHLHIDSIIKHARSVLDTEVAYKIRVLAYHAQNELLKSIYAGLEFLDLLGIKLPKNPGTPAIMVKFLTTRWAMRNETPDTLLNKPLMTDPNKLAAIRMLSYLNGPTYIGLPNLNPILVLEQVRLSMRYGNTAASSSGYGGYGLILCGVTGEMKQGALYGQLAKDVIEKFDSQEEFAKAHLISNVFVRHWTMPIMESQNTTSEIYLNGVAAGDYVFAAYGAEVYCFMHLFAGTPLSQVREEVDSYDHAVWNVINQKNTALAVSSIRQTIHHLQDPEYRSGKISGEFYDYDKSFEHQVDTNDLNGVFKAAVYQMMMYYLFGEIELALAVSRTASKFKDAGIALFHIGYYYFYKALILIELLPEMSAGKATAAKLEIALCLQKIKWYKRYSPYSYENKYYLILAQKERYNNHSSKAMEYFEKAIHAAGSNGLLHERALATEIYTHYLKDLGRMESMVYFLKKALIDYQNYGAQSKVRLLKEEFKDQLPARSSSIATRSFTEEGTRHTSTMTMDMTTILKVSQVISSEIVLEDLLERIMSLLLENAGANQGWLLIKEKDQWFIRAEKSINENGLNSDKDQPLSSIPDAELPVSKKIIEYVDRTSQPIVLDDAAVTGKYAQDSTIRRLKSKSVFCSPIIHQGKTLGVIYLVNDLIPNVFTEENVDMLTLLSSQLSISLQNALLYDNLDSKVRQRTEDLVKEKETSEKLLHNILPTSIASELKDSGSVEARHYPQASVLFTDFKNFTQITEQADPKELVAELDYIFSKFDEISSEHGIEKIKTIGDSYMAASGIPNPTPDDEINIVRAAIAMRDFLEQTKQEKQQNGKSLCFEARIGIHTGPLIAGVVGMKKFSYDVWGGTVNLASRMESNGEAGKINISGDTYKFIKDKFNCTHRGQIKVKNQGKFDMYFVEGEN